MEDGFVKAYSDNLPHIDFEMVCVFTSSTTDYVSAEIKHGKTKRSTRESYGDNAVGYVQLKRDNNICLVKAKITPEHKINKKNYNVYVKVDEEENKILECKCCDCSASEGGCKHGIAFLFWLHRRSEEPALTSKECYWKKSHLTAVKDHKTASLSELVDKEIPPLINYNGRFLEKIKTLNYSGGLFDFFTCSPFGSLSIHHMIINFEATGYDKSAENFLKFMMDTVLSEKCVEAEKATKGQSKSSLWYNLRYSRITASRLYEAARCKTVDGVLVEKILGASKPFQSEAMRRGLDLEDDVLKKVAEEKGLNIVKCGLFLSKDYPIFGASPDGLTAEYCIEIKCPSEKQAIKNYVENNVIKRRYYFQIQLQMLLTKRKTGLFCVASPTFENTKHVDIFEVEYNEEECKEVISLAESFWKLHIFPKIL